MALGKEFTKTISFNCTQEELKNAVRESINILGLKLKENKITEDQIYFLASEKMSFLSTNWPVSYDIRGKKIQSGWRLIIKCWAKMTSITQDRHTEKKPQEFIEIVKDSGNFKTVSEKMDSTDSNISNLEKLAELRDKGVITEGEFQQKKKDLLSSI
jgi:hypothetical protein